MLLDTRNACCLAGALGPLSLVVVVMMNQHDVLLGSRTDSDHV